MWGILTGAAWTMDLSALGGQNNIGIIFKRGLNNFPQFPDTAYFDLDLEDYQENKRDQSWRLLLGDWFAFQLNPHFSLQGQMLFRTWDKGKKLDNGKKNMNYWYSAGLQPAIHFGQYFAVVTEAALDYVDDKERGEGGHLAKFTVAPKVTGGPNWWAQPSVMAFFTYANWDPDLGLAWSWSNRAYGASFMPREQRQSQGISTGVMFETFF
jgi:maltoporin